jgi:site-specific DNA-adenine methylase
MNNKNEFFFGYAGNKRKEVKYVIDYINEKTDIFNGENHYTIVEPFCGSCAISIKISQLYPNQFTYVLNDCNKLLFDLLKIAKDEDKFLSFQNELNEKIKTIINKEVYLECIKEKTLIAWFIKNLIYTIRPGMYNFNYKPKTYDFTNKGIISFLRNENVIILNNDGTEVYEEFMGKTRCVIICDPPYLDSCNEFYSSKTTNIYEYVAKSNINNNMAKTIFILENNWIVKLLFANNLFIEYDKTYEGSKKKTTHLMISNF